jgi:branched-chain amino acid transport system permease protein
MDSYLLYAFTAAIIGGLSSLWGVFIGGGIVGIASSLVTIYGDPDIASVSVFGLLILVLMARPSGIFGDPSLVERL